MKRPALWASIFMICGIYMRLGISEMICLASFLFLVGAISYFVKKRRWYLIFVIFPLFGFVLAGNSIQLPLPNFSGSMEISEEAVVKATKELESGNQKLSLSCWITTENGEEVKEVGISAVWTGEERFRVGDKVLVTGELLELSGPSFPGGYDERKDLMTKGMQYKIFPEGIEKTGEVNSLASMIRKAKERIFEGLDAVLPPKESGVVKAMVTGEREDIAAELWELYAQGGISHILCISGLHISMLALSFLYFMEKICGLKQKTASWATIFFTLGFLIFAGFSPPVVRAVILIFLVLLGRILWRKADLLNSVALGALFILCIQPLYLWNAGFQLSFVTVLGIAVAMEHVTHKKGRFTGIKNTCIISLYASLFSFPLVAYHFYSISLIGILVNLLVLPFCGLLLGLSVFTSLLSLILPQGAVFLGGSVYVILRFYEGVCTLAGMVPGGYLLLGRPELLSIALYYLLFIAISFYGRKFCGKESVAFLLLSLTLSVFANRWFFQQNTVTFLDVGQGDAIVISTYDNRGILIDGGGRYGKAFGENTGITVVKPYLEYLGIEHLDGIFITHPDNDHMIGALEVAREMPVDGIYISDYPFENEEGWALLKETVEKSGTMLYTVKQDTRGDWEKSGELECLYPPGDVLFLNNEDNHGSMVLKYTYGNTRFLFTGDAGREGENEMLTKGMDLEAEVLKLGHHGSRESTSEAFLAAVSAEAAIVSAGENNLYGHPHKETLTRLEEEQLYRTDKMKTITVRVSPRGGYKITTMTERKAVYERIKEAMEKQ